MSPRNVVFVGFGVGSVPNATALRDSLPETHRLIIISATEVGYSTFSSVRGAVVPGWEEKIVIPLDNYLPQGSRHLLLTGTKVVKLNKNSVVIDKPHAELGNTIEFDYAVIATGVKYAAPWYAAEQVSDESVKSSLRSYQSSLAAATSVLIVGGGPVGIEVAGEITAHAPDKKVTLVTAADKLLGGPGLSDKMRNNLLGQLNAKGVKVVFGQKADTKGQESGSIPLTTFDLGAAGSVEADYLLDCTGGKPNTDLVRALDASLIDDKGYVRVNKHLQIESTDGSLDHIFVSGSAGNTNEPKTAMAAKRHGDIISSNIKTLISAAPKASLKTYSPMEPNLMLVSFGPTGGAGVIFGWNIGAWIVGLIKGRSLLISMVRPQFGAK